MLNIMQQRENDILIDFYSLVGNGKQILFWDSEFQLGVLLRELCRLKVEVCFSQKNMRLYILV